MGKLTKIDTIILRLIERSSEQEDRWCQVSDDLWFFVKANIQSDLVEYDDKHKRIRLSVEGMVVVKYL